MISGGNGSKLDSNGLPNLNQHRRVAGIYVAQFIAHGIVGCVALMTRRAILMASCRPSSGVAVMREPLGTREVLMMSVLFCMVMGTRKR
jgi:hypothetical protein